MIYLAAATNFNQQAIILLSKRFSEERRQVTLSRGAAESSCHMYQFHKSRKTGPASCFSLLLYKPLQKAIAGIHLQGSSFPASDVLSCSSGFTNTLAKECWTINCLRFCTKSSAATIFLDLISNSCRAVNFSRCPRPASKTALLGTQRISRSSQF